MRHALTIAVVVLIVASVAQGAPTHKTDRIGALARQVATLRHQVGALNTRIAGLEKKATIEPSRLTVVQGQIIPLFAGQAGRTTVTCPFGRIALGGGAYGGYAYLTASGPLTGSDNVPSGWVVQATNSTGDAVGLRAAVICA